MEKTVDLNLKATELRLGLPGTEEEKTIGTAPAKSNKRQLPETASEDSSVSSLSNNNNNSNKASNSNIGQHMESDHHADADVDAAPPSKAKIVGWPPIRSYRKNSSVQDDWGGNGMYYVKVSMDGAPYLRKIDLKVYGGYPQLLKALESMFKLTIGDYSEREGYKASEYAPTYEDKDGDWMLLGDVPWDMFMTSCKRLRIMKGSETRGLGCAAV